MNEQAAEEWIKKAEDNYTSALTLLRQRKHPVPGVVCSQAQPCVEKYLKAFLVYHNIDFPYVHDLVQLEELAVRVEPDFRTIHSHLALLNPYGIAIRYPGLDASIPEAREGVKAMKKVRKFVRTKLIPKP